VAFWTVYSCSFHSHGRIGTTIKHEIAFFERNGLRHGEILLPDPDVRVCGLSWNSDSELLAVAVVKPRPALNGGNDSHGTIVFRSFTGQTSICGSSG